MISDVLFEAIDGLNWYLNNSVYDRMYNGSMRQKIIMLRAMMDEVLNELDNPWRTKN